MAEKLTEVDKIIRVIIYLLVFFLILKIFKII